MKKDTQKKKAFKVSDNHYTFEDGFVLKREFGTITPNGNKINGFWVYRNAQGDFIDYNQYINDIECQYNLCLYPI